MVGNAVLVKKYFEEVFKDRFESLGFKPAKTKNLYSIRVINDEIIHIIGLREMVDFVVPFGAVATVYRKDLCLNKSFRLIGSLQGVIAFRKNDIFEIAITVPGLNNLSSILYYKLGTL